MFDRMFDENSNVDRIKFLVCRTSNLSSNINLFVGGSSFSLFRVCLLFLVFLPFFFVCRLFLCFGLFVFFHLYFLCSLKATRHHFHMKNSSLQKLRPPYWPTYKKCFCLPIQTNGINDVFELFHLTNVLYVQNAKFKGNLTHIKSRCLMKKSDKPFKHSTFTFVLKKMFDENMFWNMFHQTWWNTIFLENVKILPLHKPFKDCIQHQEFTMFDEMFEQFAPTLIVYVLSVDIRKYLVCTVVLFFNFIHKSYILFL